MGSARFLIIGAKGQLGKALLALFPQAIAVDRDELDVTSWDALQAFDWGSVDVIINAAAYTNVDGAETPEGRKAAWLINAQAPAYLTKIAIKYTLTLVHISSDYVFDGTQSPHTEAELLSPLGVYAQTKAAGDIVVGVAPKHYIIRLGWLIGNGPNFVRTMMGLAEKNSSPTVVADQIGRLTFTDTAAACIKHLLSTNAAYGIYNLSNDGEPASWADITRRIFKELGRADLTVTDTTTEAYFHSKPNISPRPLQSTLDLGKVKATGLHLADWRAALHEYIEREQHKE